MQPGRHERLAGAASLWAISSSWCGKMRSTPPVWMSKDVPRWAMLIAEHSMCQPGPPGAESAVSHADGSPGFGPFHRAKSRTSSLAYSSASTRSPTRSPSGSSRGSRPYAGHEAIRKKIEPSSVR